MAKRTPQPKTARQIDMQQRLAKRLKAIRKQRGFDNYEKFSYEIGVGRSQYGAYERGADIQFSTLVRLLEAIDMGLSEFFSEGFE